MILWANYEKLYNMFRRKNDYKFGLLSKDGYIIKPNQRIKAVELIDGVLYLFTHQTKKEALEEALKNSLKENHQFIKKNLKHLNQTIKLSVYQIRYDEKLKRVLLQPNKQHIRYVLNLIYKITHTKWPNRRIMIGKINRYIRLLKLIDETSIMNVEQKRAIQHKLRNWIMEGLTSMYGLKKKEAEEIWKKFSKKLYWEN